MIYVEGIPGSGKTDLVKFISEREACRVVDLSQGSLQSTRNYWDLISRHFEFGDSGLELESEIIRLRDSMIGQVWSHGADPCFTVNNYSVGSMLTDLLVYVNRLEQQDEEFFANSEPIWQSALEMIKANRLPPVDGWIWIDANPELCYRRLQRGKRFPEVGGKNELDIDVLSDLAERFSEVFRSREAREHNKWIAEAVPPLPERKILINWIRESLASPLIVIDAKHEELMGPYITQSYERIREMLARYRRESYFAKFGRAV